MLVPEFWLPPSYMQSALNAISLPFSLCWRCASGINNLSGKALTCEIHVGQIVWCLRSSSCKGLLDLWKPCWVNAARFSLFHAGICFHVGSTPPPSVHPWSNRFWVPAAAPWKKKKIKKMGFASKSGEWWITLFSSTGGWMAGWSW